MTDATSGAPAGVVLDWRHASTGPPAPCVFGDGLTTCRSPARDLPCHKGCAENWITTRAANTADRARLIRRNTPGKGGGR